MGSAKFRLREMSWVMPDRFRTFELAAEKHGLE